MDALHLGVRRGGRVAFDVEWTNAPHRHSYWEACLVLSGAGEFIHGDAVHPLRAGDLFLSRPDVTHEIRSRESRDLLIWFLAFSVSDELRGTRLHVSGCERLGAWIEAIEGALAPDELLEPLCREMLRLASARLLGDTPVVDGLVLQALARGAGAPVPIEALADELGVSPRTLRRRFAAAGMSSVARALAERRCNAAAHLLLMGFSVGEVAERMGFDDPTTFSRQFRRAIGQAPKAFQTRFAPRPPSTTRIEEREKPGPF